MFGFPMNGPVERTTQTKTRHACGDLTAAGGAIF